jgi:GTP pyrophosphokinase
VHTDIGNRCVAVKINDELMPLRTELRSGDRVEIITAVHAKPNPAWLGYVITGKARAHIRHFLKTMQYDESRQLGERLLSQALSGFGSSLAEIDQPTWERLVKDAGVRGKDEILADIGLGKRLSVVVARELLSMTEPAPLDMKHPGTVVIRGTEGMTVQFAQCCRPIPGDPIIGWIKKGQGIVIHTHDCPVMAKTRADPDKYLDVEWDPETKKLFDVSIKLIALNRRGVLARIAAEIADAESNIDNVGMDTQDGSQYSTVHFTLQVHDRLHLAQVMRALRRIPEVVRITRVKGSSG